MSKVEMWHGDMTNQNDIATKTLQAFIDFQHKVQERLYIETKAKEIMVKFEVRDDTKPHMLDLNVFVNFYREGIQDKYWPWIDVDVNDLLDHENFMNVIVEKITRELKGT